MISVLATAQVDPKLTSDALPKVVPLRRHTLHTAVELKFIFN